MPSSRPKSSCHRCNICIAASGVRLFRPRFRSPSTNGWNGRAEERELDMRLLLRWPRPGVILAWPRRRRLLLLQLREDLLAPLDHARSARLPAGRFVDAVALVGVAPGIDLVQKDDLLLPFADRHVQVLDAGERISPDSVSRDSAWRIVCGTEMLVQVLDDAPGERKAIVRARAAADLIQNHQVPAGWPRRPSAGNVVPAAGRVRPGRRARRAGPARQP